MSAVVAGAAAPVSTTARRPRGGLIRAILRNRKAVAGAILLLLFILLAAFPHLFVPLQPPSGKHWLGTTGLGQDVYAELIYSTRESLVIAVIAGAGATILSVII